MSARRLFLVSATTVIAFFASACGGGAPSAVTPAVVAVPTHKRIATEPCPIPQEKAVSSVADLENMQIARICFRGSERTSGDTLRASIASRSGSPFTAEGVQKDIESLYAQGHLSDVEARASLTAQGVVLVFILSERSP